MVLTHLLLLCAFFFRLEELSEAQCNLTHIIIIRIIIIFPKHVQKYIVYREYRVFVVFKAIPNITKCQHSKVLSLGLLACA